MAGQLLGLNTNQISSTVHSTAENWSEGATGVFRAEDTLVVLNKVDLIKCEQGTLNFDMDVLRSKCEGAEVCGISCKTREGVDQFMKCMEKILKTMYD